MNYKKCYNFQDFRSLAKSKLPSPIFNYIDGAADDEVTYRRNTSSFDDVSLIPAFYVELKMLTFQLLFLGKTWNACVLLTNCCTEIISLWRWRAVAKAADKFGTMFGVSSLGTVSVEEVSKISSSPKMFQFYFHKDRGLNNSMLERAKALNLMFLL